MNSKRRIGSLSLVHGRLSFAYAPDWLALPQARALSQSLLLQVEPFDDHQTRPFFAGVLPEGQMRRLIAQQFQVSGQNDFSLLDHIGGECAGGVTFLEPGQALPQTNGTGATGATGDVEWLGVEKLLALLGELPRRPMLAGDDGLRLSLAGAQDKLPVVVDESMCGSACRAMAHLVRISGNPPSMRWRIAWPTKAFACCWPRCLA
ncbi:HipA N-terminal domain-containing protein [Comamonas testosteroni]|uniref:HipA N-terminal domain-containing protein n=1 Tax=Comamonas testosteroni TaxID=285 RepID=UPI0026F348E8|nr:HipA N-terminal domain-containing protein [Comamonas testosteroni]WQD45518.1 HipA N-terminal domain-containing protein [Comamonas testosteroni]